MTPRISSGRSARETGPLEAAMEAAESARDSRAAVDAYQAALAHRCAHHTRTLGHGPDELAQRANRFLEAWRRPAPGSWAPQFSDDIDEPYWERACEHCGYEPERENDLPDSSWELSVDEAAAALPPSTHLETAFAWFPADQWRLAVERWPDLLQDNPTDHGQYSRKIQTALLRFASHSTAPKFVAGLDVDGLVSYSAERGYDPGSGEARSAYAAELLRVGRATRWPPGRNHRCWCGSGRKYKVCCGTVFLS